MRIIFTLTLSFLISTPSIFAQDYYDQGVYWFNKRADVADGLIADSTNINKAIYYFKKSFEQEDQEVKTGVMLLRSYYFKAEFTGTSHWQQENIFFIGKNFGKRLAEKYDQSVPVLYFYAANLGKWGEKIGAFRAARLGIADKMRELCKKMIDLDPSYENGGPYRVLSILYYKLPYIPLILTWPSNEKALNLIKDAMKYESDDIANLRYYAEILMEMGEDDKAKQILERLSHRSPRENLLIEDRKYLDSVEKLLAKF